MAQQWQKVGILGQTLGVHAACVPAYNPKLNITGPNNPTLLTLTLFKRLASRNFHRVVGGIRRGAVPEFVRSCWRQAAAEATAV